MSNAFTKIAKAIDKWATTRPNKGALFGGSARKPVEQETPATPSQAEAAKKPSKQAPKR